MTRAHYSVLRVAPQFVVIRDCDDGHMSITNDAEAVVREVNSLHPGRRIFYYDTDHRCDELVHKDGFFTGFNALEQGLIGSLK